MPKSTSFKHKKQKATEQDFAADVTNDTTNPKSSQGGFKKLSYKQIGLRILLWVMVVGINEMGWLNPQNQNFILRDHELKDIDLIPIFDYIQVTKHGLQKRWRYATGTEWQSEIRIRNRLEC